MGCLRYIAYRTLVSLTGNAWLSASSAALQDVYGRGSQAFALASSRVQRCALLAMMAGTYAVRWLRPRPAFGLVALLQLLAAGVVACMKETLVPEPQAGAWKISFWSFFRASAASARPCRQPGESRRLWALGLLSTALELPEHVATLDVVTRRQRFAWSSALESTHILQLQVAGVMHTCPV